MLIFEFAAPGQEVSRRHLHILRDLLLHFCHQAAHVAIANENADGRNTQAEFAAYLKAEGEKWSKVIKAANIRAE